MRRLVGLLLQSVVVPVFCLDLAEAYFACKMPHTKSLAQLNCIELYGEKIWLYNSTIISLRVKEAAQPKLIKLCKVYIIYVCLNI